MGSATRGGKQFLYDEGLHVPLVIAGPTIEPGQVRDDLVEHIDIAALSLGIAGIEIPRYMQSRDILSEEYNERTAIFAARDRCDETVDHIRAVRTGRYKYIRNFCPIALTSSRTATRMARIFSRP